jgi:Phosphodiester glycosidase
MVRGGLLMFLLILCPAFQRFAVAGEAIQVRPFERMTSDGPVRGMVAEVDLGDPRVSVKTTAPVVKGATSRPTGGSAVNAGLMTTDQWAKVNGVTLAVNAGYFGWVKGGGAHLVGLAVSDGVLVSPTRTWKGQPDPALVFLTDGTARVIGPGQPSVVLADVRQAVSGVGGSESDPERGTLLVQGGKNLGATARVYPKDLHSRTAVGVDETGRRIFVVVIDGRQPQWSVGMNLPALADLMISLGAKNAINLDGGGSSSFVYRPENGTDVMTNRPSDEFNATRPGVFRAVANHLGFRVEPGPDAHPMAAGTTRPSVRPRRRAGRSSGVRARRQRNVYKMRSC